MNSPGQGLNFIEWANCFPLCCPSSKSPSGLYQTVFTANNCCLLHILTLQGPTLSKDCCEGLAGSAHTAVPRSLELLPGVLVTQNSGRPLFPLVSCVQWTEIPPHLPTPSPRNSLFNRKSLKLQCQGMERWCSYFLVASCIWKLIFHSLFFHSLSKVTRSGLSEVNWSPGHI